MIQFKILNDNARIPTRGSSEAAGLDLYAVDDFTVGRSKSVTHPIGLSMALPDGYVGLVMPRSGNAVKLSIDTGAGVIDSDYRGEIAVVLFNHGESDVEFKRGDRIAQMVIQFHHSDMPIMAVNELDESARGAAGFGSTGE